MDRIWNKENAYTTEIQIKDVLFNINCQNNIKSFSWINNFPQKENINQTINIWFAEQVSDECLKTIYKAFKEGQDYFPKAINDTYKYLGLDEEKKRKHINKYKKHNNYIYGHFRFPADDFYIVYNVGKSEIYLIGNIANLERLLNDFICMIADCLLLHAAGFSIEDKNYIMLGDSNSGKTGVLLSLIKNGISYISDDIIYLTSDGNIIRCCDYFSIRDNYVPKKMASLSLFNKGEKVFFNINDVSNSLKYKILNISQVTDFILLNPLTVSNISSTKLFAAFMHDSMWTLDILGPRYGSIEKRIEHSTKCCTDLINSKSIINFTIDYSNFEKSVDELHKQIISKEKIMVGGANDE